MRFPAVVLAFCAGALSLSSAFGQPAQHGDYAVALRTEGSIYALNPSTGDVRGLISGLEVRSGLPSIVRGVGPVVGNTFHLQITAGPDGMLYARPSFEGPLPGALYKIDPITGDRVVLAGTGSSHWDGSGDLAFLNRTTVVSTAAGRFASTVPDGKLLTHHLPTATSTVVSSPSRGDGPTMFEPRGMSLLDANTAVVTETNLPPSRGAGVFLVDLQTGDRRLLTWMTQRSGARRLISGGVDIGGITLDNSTTSGPLVNGQTRDVLVTSDKRIIVAGDCALPGGLYTGGLFEVDREDGTRTLLVGQAFDEEAGSLVTVLPVGGDISMFGHAPVALHELPDGRIAFVSIFRDDRVFAYDLNNNEVLQVASFGGSLPGDAEVAGVAVVDLEVCVSDYGGDGVADILDFLDFIQDFSECDQAPAPCGTLGNPDINGDTFVDILDFLDFIEAFSEGC